MLRTCPKCGTQFYGAGCPDCDYPARPADEGQRKQDRILGILFIAMGLGVDVAVLAHPQAVPQGLPSWPALIAGMLFCLAGFAVLTGVKGRLSSGVAGVICAGMATLGFFAALGPGELEGGIPVLPAAWNQELGRIAFGGGACLTAAFSLWWFYRAVKPCKKK